MYIARYLCEKIGFPVMGDKTLFVRPGQIFVLVLLGTVKILKLLLRISSIISIVLSFPLL